MPIVVECPSCGQKLKVPENLEGKKVRCSKCQGTFTAEAPAPPPPPPEEPAEQPPEDDYDDRPARRSKRRRDDDDGDRKAPGRGGMVMSFGIVSVVSFFVALVAFGGNFIIPFAGICTLIFNVIGLIFGILAWVMGSGDMKKIRAGFISRAAEGNTKIGYITGMIGTILNGLSLLCSCVLVILAIAGAAVLFGGAAAAARQQNNQVPANNPIPRRSFDLPPIKLGDYMPRIESR
jgi:hypothetical protein